MTGDDLAYVRRLLDERVLSGPVLELGAGYGGDTCRKIVRDAGLEYFASDMAPSSEVDFVADFESEEIDNVFPSGLRFGSVLVLNVLEHTFDPARILDNGVRLLDAAGSLVVITPAIWPIHNHPIDCYRLLPQWYEQYAQRRNLTIDRNWFEYLGYGKIDQRVDANGQYQFPRPGQSDFRHWWSRLVHRAFNTFGRGMAYPSHIAIGVVFRRAASARGTR